MFFYVKLNHFLFFLKKDEEYRLFLSESEAEEVRIELGLLFDLDPRL